MWCFSLIVLSRFCWFMFFFFSSRRRHTRCGRDWSSDVCSSDLDAARRYAGMGWSIIPVIPGKKPAIFTWREYQGRRADREEIWDWFAENNYGIAVITGAISGIVVVD